MTNDLLHLSRRHALAAFGIALAALTACPAFAAQPIVEVIAFAHPPVESALKQTRQWLSLQGTKLRVVEINMESPEAEARLKALGLKGHLPVVIIIDGQYRYTKRDGGVVEFVGFPGGNGTPAGVKATWSTADVETAIKAKL